MSEASRCSDELNVNIADALVDIDVLILTEINVEINEPLHFPKHGYHEMSVRREGKKRGGILIYVKNSWLFDRTEVSLQHAEDLVMNIQKAAISFFICALYKPPSGNLHIFYEEFDKMMNRFNNNDYIVIAGDLNIDVSSQDKYKVPDYLNILSSYGLENVITSYTREERLVDKITKK